MTDMQVHPHEHEVVYYVRRRWGWTVLGILIRLFGWFVGTGLKLLLLLFIFLAFTGAGRAIVAFAVIAFLAWGFGPSYQLSNP